MTEVRDQRTLFTELKGDVDVVGVGQTSPARVLRGGDVGRARRRAGHACVCVARLRLGHRSVRRERASRLHDEDGLGDDRDLLPSIGGATLILCSERLHHGRDLVHSERGRIDLCLERNDGGFRHEVRIDRR